MPYPDNLVQEGETLALDLRPHWWYFSRNILTGIPLAIILIVVLSSNTDWISKYGGILVGIVAIAWAVWLALKYLQWRMTYFVVTSRRVIYRSGVISKRGVEIPLERINTVFFNQSLFERMVGAGDLAIESAGERGTERMTDIRKPAVVQREIYVQMEANENRKFDRARSPASPGISTAEQLEKLHSLLQQGAITQAQFESERMKLLSS